MNMVLLYGTTTGETERAAQTMVQVFKTMGHNLFCEDVAFLEHSDPWPHLEPALTLFGISTWYYGAMQSDWEAWLPKLKESRFWHHRPIALFGCGDQEAYEDYFCDAVGLLYHDHLAEHSDRLIGLTDLSSYHFNHSKAQLPCGRGCGLLLDEINQPDQTLPRIEAWCRQLCEEIAPQGGSL